MGVESRSGVPLVPAAADESLWPLLTGRARRASVLAVAADALYLGVGATVIVVCGATAMSLPGAVTIAQPLSDVLEMDHLGPVYVGNRHVVIGNVTIEVGRWTAAARPRLQNVYAAEVRAREVARRIPSLPPMLDGRASDLLRGLRDDDHAAVQEAVDCLVGLGPGLTPAGDDFLAGATLGLRAADDIRGNMLAAAIAARRDRTTAISAALLDGAATGRCISQAARFLAALDGRSDLEPALAALLAVGHTSGAAIARGIVLALTLPPSSKEAA